MNRRIATLIATARPNFLILTLVCVFLGIATASQVTSINLGLATLILITALLAHISVNMLNEYHDYCSGLDLTTDRTPFSGGSGALPSHPESAKEVKSVALTLLSLCTLSGLYLMQQNLALLMPLGILGLFIVLTYTPVLNRHPIACLISAGIGFGPIMVLGTHISLTGGLAEQAVLASIIPFCLVNNLLLLNQYPDIDADSASGRYHLLIAYGRHTGAKVYTLFNAVMIAGMVLLIQTVGTDLFGLLLTGAVSIAAIGLSILVLNNAANQTKLNQLMGPNVALTLATPTMLSILMIWN